MKPATPNKPDAPNPAIAPRFHVGHHCRRVGDPGRSVSPVGLLDFRQQLVDVVDECDGLRLVAVKTAIGPQGIFDQSPLVDGQGW